MTPSVVPVGLTYPWRHPHTPNVLTVPQDIIEFAGRWDYAERSLAKMGTDPTIIGRWLASGEESMIEMVDASFLITCSRVVSHELVRHRLASFQQESQRFVSYEDEQVLDLFYDPSVSIGSEGEVAAALMFAEVNATAWAAYRELRQQGVSRQLARYVLPNATRTRIVAKANLREWRHILRLRMHPSAQPEMREVATLIYVYLNDAFPDIFGDIPALIEKERAAR